MAKYPALTGSAVKGLTSLFETNANYVLSDVGVNACDALMDSSPTSPSEGRQEAGSVQSSDSEFY